MTHIITKCFICTQINLLVLFRTESVKNFTITGNLLPSLKIKMPRKKSIKTETEPSSDIPLLYYPIIHQLYVSQDLFFNVYPVFNLLLFILLFCFSERCQFDQFPTIWISISSKFISPRILGRHEGATNPTSDWHGSSSPPPPILPRPIVAIPQPFHGAAPSISLRKSCQKRSSR